jgi:hypothetical protein
LLLAVQLWFAVIVNEVVLFASAPILRTVGDTERAGRAAFCVTVIVLEVTPDPEIVITAVRGDVTVFAAAVTVIVALLDPDMVLKVSQFLLLLAVQFMLDVIVNVEVLFAAAFRPRVVGDTVKNGTTTAAA